MRPRLPADSRSSPTPRSWRGLALADASVRRMPTLVLHALPPSHPCMTAEAALRLKGLDYERIDFQPGRHVEDMQRIYGEGKSTVPGLLVDDEPVHGSRAILARLEELEPEPSLHSTDEVRAAEQWSDDNLPDLGPRL